jgi:hypothetical protein
MLFNMFLTLQLHIHELANVVFFFVEYLHEDNR